ncbi:hypothetical protein R84981_001732 [Carnimonas sp. R-84981]|uniref:hypothetical protein n=1 Tax=Carnimonas bestiolae TaxID=3402172 RepID=UPI003EDC984D
MTFNERKRQRFIMRHTRWPHRDGVYLVDRNCWHVKGDVAVCGNLMVTKSEWIKERWAR